MIVALIPFFHFFFFSFSLLSRSFFLSLFIYSLGIVFKMIETRKHLYESACCIAYCLISIPVKCVHLEYKYLTFSVLWYAYSLHMCDDSCFETFVRLFCEWNVRTQQLTQINKKLNYFTGTHKRASGAWSENKIVDSINKGQRLGCVAKANSKQRERRKNIMHEFLFP